MKKLSVLLLLVGIAVFGLSSSSFGFSSSATAFKTKYPSSPLSSLSTVSGQAGNLCTVCHGPSAPPLNSYGTAYRTAGQVFSAALEAADSDGDTFSNITEINAGTFPGNNASVPGPAPDTTLPTVTAFTIPATASTLTVGITSFTASDNVGVTGYLVNESATKPLPGAAGWNAAKPTSYTFASAGAKTLYAWAKDAAGNVSNSLSATVTITLPPAPDTTLPTVTAFTIPATASTLTVGITSFTASDNVGVTGYMVNGSATAPLVTDTRWTTSAPTSRTFAAAGAKTLYAWAKDAAGNVSLSKSATVVITLSAIPIIDVPASQQIFSYSARAYPFENEDISKARPLGIGSMATGGDLLELRASIGPFSGPVDAYITIFAPSAGGNMEPTAIYTLKPDGSFEYAEEAELKLWKQDVTDINEHIGAIPSEDLLPGPYIMVLTVTPAGSQSSYYKWTTSFIVR